MRLPIHKSGLSLFNQENLFGLMDQSGHYKRVSVNQSKYYNRTCLLTSNKQLMCVHPIMAYSLIQITYLRYKGNGCNNLTRSVEDWFIVF